MNLATYFAIANVFLLVITTTRLEIVSHVRFKAMDMIYEANRKRLERGCYTDELWDAYHSYQSFGAMMLDLRKWTFNQFYPGLKERIAK